MSVTGAGSSPIQPGADYDRTANPIEINAGFAVNNRNALASVGATRALTNTLAVGLEGGITNINDYSAPIRGFAGATVTNHFNNRFGADPYVAADYKMGFGAGGLDHTVGGKVGITAPISDKFNLGMYVGADRTLGNGPTAGWSGRVGLTMGFRFHK